MRDPCVLLLLLSSVALSQTRTEELTRQRMEYAGALAAEKLSGAEQFLVRVKEERFL